MTRLRRFIHFALRSFSFALVLSAAFADDAAQAAPVQDFVDRGELVRQAGVVGVEGVVVERQRDAPVAEVGEDG